MRSSALLAWQFPSSRFNKPSKCSSRETPRSQILPDCRIYRLQIDSMAPVHPLRDMKITCQYDRLASADFVPPHSGSRKAASCGSNSLPEGQTDNVPMADEQMSKWATGQISPIRTALFDLSVESQDFILSSLFGLQGGTQAYGRRV